jgi:NTP pyrophosphatase (non-canonical NTP hydrolase)
MLIVSELGEACEALRTGMRQDGKNKEWYKDSFEDELADAMIRICDLSESEGIDLEWQIKKKMKYNQTRLYKHGKKF